MPKYRKLHVKATESEDINEMPDDFTRLLWIMLPLGLDREGRGLDNPAWIKSKIFPIRLDVTPQMIAAAMDWYTSRKMIVRYSVENRRYFYLPTFHTYQGDTTKETVSTYPPPPMDDPTPEQVKSSAEPTQEPVKSKLSSDSDSDSNTDSDADANSSPPEGGANRESDMNADEYKQRLVRAMNNGASREYELQDAVFRELHISPNWETKTARAFMRWLKMRPEDETLADFAAWWKSEDWRGKQGQPPTLDKVQELWPQAVITSIDREFRILDNDVRATNEIYDEPWLKLIAKARRIESEKLPEIERVYGQYIDGSSDDRDSPTDYKDPPRGDPA